LSKEKSDVMDEDDEDEDDEVASSSPKKNLKRTSESETETETSPKKNKLDDKKVYVAPSSSKSNSKHDVKQQPAYFINIFNGKSFFISKNVEKHQEIKRYIVA
jgi:hypothetical protein